MRNLLSKPLRVAKETFLLVAEPRITRIIQFVIYVTMLCAGIGILVSSPRGFESVIGAALVIALGVFAGFGGLLGAIGVLPGIWWLERAGIFSIVTALSLYSIVAIGLGSSFIGWVIGVGFALTFVQRWREIRGDDLAPKRG